MGYTPDFPNTDGEKHIIRNTTFQPERDKAVFYSDDSGRNMIKAGNAVGLQHIGRTTGGTSLNEPNRQDKYVPACGKSFAKALYKEFWDKASEKYAQAAEGKVTTFVCGSSPKSTFRRVELKELIHNEKVTEINGIPREVYQKAYAQEQNPQKGLNKAYELVCEAELKQTKEKALSTGDPSLSKDHEQRQAAFDKQFNRQQNQPQQSKSQHQNLISKHAPGTSRDNPNEKQQINSPQSISQQPKNLQQPSQQNTNQHQSLISKHAPGTLSGNASKTVQQPANTRGNSTGHKR